MNQKQGKRIITIALLASLIFAQRCIILKTTRTKPTEVNRTLVSSVGREELKPALKVSNNIDTHNSLLIKVTGHITKTTFKDEEFDIDYMTTGSYYPPNAYGDRISWSEYWWWTALGGIPTFGLTWVSAIIDWATLPIRLSSKEITTKRKTIPRQVGSSIDDLKNIKSTIRHDDYLDGKTPILSSGSNNGEFKFSINKLLGKVGYDLRGFRFELKDQSNNKLHTKYINLGQFNNNAQIGRHIAAHQNDLLDDLEATLNEVMKGGWDNDSATAYRIAVMFMKGVYYESLDTSTPELIRLKESLSLFSRTSNIYNRSTTTGRLIMDVRSARRSLK